MAKSLPFAHTELSAFLAKRVLELRPRKNQVEIATQAGFVNTNMLSMIKSGKTRLPLDRVPSLAKALECDAKRLFQLAITQDGYETTRTVIEEIFGTVVSQNEVRWLEAIRDASEHTDPALTLRTRATIRGMFGK